tara:strand:- start:115 stop:339 length:225 start_codon:yes stop_codon:yes gene_type:complete
MSSDCPVHCVNVACTQPDWLETHESFVITMAGLIGTGLGVLLSYFLKSRCEVIRIGCIYCKRKVLEVGESPSTP